MTEKLTFKEAIFEAETAAKFGKDPVHKWHLEQLKKLQVNYTLRIEMTPDEYELPILIDDFMLFDSLKQAMVENLREAAKKSLLWRYTQEYGYDYLCNFSEYELYRICLHPETIINSETGKPFVEE